ncbi:sugar ABC transporter permease [Thermoanaerobacter brockii subsp. lactiethylicus]|jgi:sn-glycerol 3-phosphate transport system permease protein|uniref:carbohydrate ABC transporter permease n=1 Tax=Thermoanaerobacter sp. A7A TaxID=1350366 RepID=UPI000420BC55|nr:sugar ABC transporter permease [Thermoanaerobacter sp. A7A]
MYRIETIHSKESYKVKRHTLGMPLKNFKAEIEPYLYLLPAASIFIAFTFYPFFKTIYISLFMTGPQGGLSKFIGLKNYFDLLASPDFLNSLYVTFEFVLLTVPFSIIISLVLAIFANLDIKGKSVFRTFYALPISISSASAAVIWTLLFNPSIGFINYLLSFFGIPAIGWLTDVKWGIVAVSIVTIWLNLGMNFIFLLGGLQNIPKDLYESAQIDGANVFLQHVKITIPMLSPTLFFVTVVDIINAFQQFGVINIMTQGGPVDSTNVIVYSIYRDAFFNFRFGVASAESIILFVILLILTVLQFKTGERRVFYR